jgi:hypothetical protein
VVATGHEEIAATLLRAAKVSELTSWYSYRTIVTLRSISDTNCR